MKNTKRIIAAVLTVIMMISMLPSNAFATESAGNDAAESAVEAVSVPGEVQEIESTVEDVSEENLETSEAVQESSEEVQTVEDAEPAEAEETEQTAEIPAEETVLYPEMDLEGRAGRVTVKVHAPEGALPAGTELKVEKVKKADVEDLVNEATEGEVSDFVAVDVSFHVNGQEEDFAPLKEVKVEFVLDKDVLPETDSYDIIHVAVDEKGKETPEVIEEKKIVDEITAEGGTISQKEFSVFIIAANEKTSADDTDTEKAVETYYFYIDGEVVDDYTQAVKAGDTLKEPPVPENPNGIFTGWYEMDPETGDISEEPFTGFGTISAVDPSSRAEHHLVPGFDEAYYVTFHEGTEDESIIITKKAASGKEVATDDVTAQSLSNRQVFDGWTETKGSAVKVGDTITVTGNVDLYPVFVQGYVLTFNANDGSTGEASSTPTQYLKGNDPTTKPGDPVREGYDFGGWYTEAAGTNEFTFGTALTTDTTVYAKWTPAQTTYRVVVWKQKVTDDRNATDAQKTYDFEESSDPISANTGATVNALTDASLSSYRNKGYTGFSLNRDKTNKNITVSGDGTTVVNVYYDRKKITYEFRGALGGLLDVIHRRARANETPTHYFSLRNLISGKVWFEAGTGPEPNKTPTHIEVRNQNMTGLYGQSLSKYGYKWPEGRWNYGYRWRQTLTFTNTFQYWDEAESNTQTFQYNNSWPDYSIVNYIETEDGKYELDNVVNGYEGLFWSGRTFQFESKYIGFAPAKYLFRSENDSIPEAYESITGIGTACSVGDMTDIPNNRDLYVFHKRNEHRIEFRYQNGEEIEITDPIKYETPLVAYKDKEAVHQSDPTHYEFTGWYRNKDLDDKINFESMTMPDSPFVAYAGFKKVEYQVTIEPNGGFFGDGSGASKTVSVKYDEKTSEPVVTREDYILTGWTASHVNGEQGPWTFASDTVKENLTITAGWYYTKDIKLQYYCDDVLVLTESYRDGAEARIAHSVDGMVIPEGKYFKGWSLNGTSYLPGQMYTVNAANMDENGVIRLDAEFSEYEENEGTNLKLYTTKANTTIKFLDESDEAGPDGFLQMSSENVNTEEYDLSEITGEHEEGLFDLIGWSTADDNTAEFKTTDLVAADNLDGTLDSDGCNVLYAVWRAKFRIYHSSDGKTSGPIAVPANGKVDIASYVSDGYMYGGYYVYEENTEGHRGEAYTVPGTAMSPNPDDVTTYYLKEVSTAYLAPQVFAVWYNYSNHKLTQLHLMTNVDEDAYSDYGVSLSINGAEATDCSAGNVYNDKLTLTQLKSDGTQTDTIYTPEGLFGVEGYFAAFNKSDELVKDDCKFSMIGYYVTPDNVRVTGSTRWSIDLGKLDKTAVVLNSENPGWNYVKPATLGNAAPAAAPAAPRMIRAYRVVQDPDSFNITKVDGSAEYVQKVGAGDNTGKLTYEGKAGYVFAGWYTDKAFKNAADLSNVQSNMTVYAKYEAASRVKLSFKKKSVKNGTVTLKATLKITDMSDIENVSVICSAESQHEVGFGSPAVSKVGKLVTETYNGTVELPGLTSGSTFTAVISYTTPDGTNVSLSAKNCKYSLGVVTVK